MPTIRELVAQQASSMTSFAATNLSDPSLTPAWTNLLSNNAVLSAVVQDANINQIQFVFQDQIKTMSFPTFGQDPTARNIVVGHMGDTPSVNPTPMTISRAQLEKHFISVLSRESCDAAGFLRSPTNYNDFVKPVAAESGFDVVGEQILPGELGFPTIQSENKSPVLCSIPVFCPVLPGKMAFHDIDINLFDVSAHRLRHPELCAWIDAIKWIRSYNDGKSLHQAESTIDYNAVDHSRFPNNAELGNPFLTINAPDGATLSTFANRYKHARLQAAYRFSENTNLPSASDETRPMQVVFDPAALAAFQASQQKVHVSKSDQEFQDGATENITKWKLLFAKKTTSQTDETTVQEIKLPEPTAEFKKLMTTTQARKANTDFVQAYKQTGLKIASAHGMFSLFIGDNKTHEEKIFSEAIRTFHLSNQAYQSDPTAIKDRIGVPHFAPPDFNDLSYMEYVEHGNKLRRQELGGEDKSKRTRQKDTIFHHGNVNSYYQLNQTLAQLLRLSIFMFGDQWVDLSKPDDLPLLWKHLLQITDCWQSDIGQSWIHHHESNYPHIFYHLLQNVQNIFQAHVQIAQVPSLVTIASEGHTIPVSYFASLANFANSTNSTQANIFQLGTLGEYANQSFLQTVMVAAVSKSPTPQPIIQSPPPNKRGADLSNMVSPDKRQSSDTPQKRPKIAPEEVDKLKLKGLLKHNGHGRPPSFPQTFIHPSTKTETPICSNYVFKGSYCLRPNCKFFHANSWSALPNGANKTAFRKAVEDHAQTEIINPQEAMAGQ